MLVSVKNKSLPLFKKVFCVCVRICVCLCRFVCDCFDMCVMLKFVLDGLVGTFCKSSKTKSMPLNRICSNRR